jgi:hypothetical protein
MRTILKYLLDTMEVREAIWDTRIYQLLCRDSAGRKRDQATCEFYRGFAEDNRLLGKLWYDIGANVGSKAAVFLELCSQLIAVEPDPGNFGHAQAATALRT